jgi:hypothetical protein
MYEETKVKIKSLDEDIPECAFKELLIDIGSKIDSKIFISILNFFPVFE